jgi:hypothetical protein
MLVASELTEYRLHDLRQRKEMEELQENLRNLAITSTQQDQTYHAAFNGHTSTLHSHSTTQQANHAQILQQIQKTSKKIDLIRADIHQQHQMIRPIMREEYSHVSPLITGQSLETNVEHTTSAQMIQEAHCCISNTDTLTRIFRSELQSVLKPMLEETLTKSIVRNEAMVQHINNVINDMTYELGRYTSEDENSLQRKKTRNEEAKPQHESFWNMSSLANETPSAACVDSTLAHPPSVNNLMQTGRGQVMRKSKYPWWFQGIIGSLQVIVDRELHGAIGLQEYHTYFSVYVYFRPCHIFWPTPGVSMFTLPLQATKDSIRLLL